MRLAATTCIRRRGQSTLATDFEFLRKSQNSDLRFIGLSTAPTGKIPASCKEGQIDILPQIYKTPSGEQECLFSSSHVQYLHHPQRPVSLILHFPSYRKFLCLSGMVGIIKDSVDGENFKVTTENNIALTVIPCSSQDLQTLWMTALCLALCMPSGPQQHLPQRRPDSLQRRFTSPSQSRPDVAEAIPTAHKAPSPFA